MLKKVVIFIVLAALLLLAGKFGLEYSYRQKLDELVQTARLHAQVSYNDLHIDLDGSVNIGGIAIRPNQLNNEIKVNNIRLFSSDRLFLLKGLEIFANGNLPESFSVNVDDLEMSASLGVTSGSHVGCNYLFSEMDISPLVSGNLVSDIDISLDASNKSEAQISINAETQDVYSVNGSIGFDGFAFSDAEPAVVLQQMAVEGDLPIKTLSFSAEYDPQFADKFLNYCASLLGLDVEQYLLDIVGADQYYQRLGFVPSSQLKQAMLLFSKGAGELSVQATPSKSGRNFRRLSAYQPQDIAKFLNLSVQVGDQDIPELFMEGELAAKLNKKEAKKGWLSNSEASSLRNKKNRQKLAGKRLRTPQSTTIKKQVGYRKVRLADAKRYIGRDVRVKRRGRLLEGNLLSWGDNKVVLERYRFGGRTEMPLNVDEIKGLEVRR